MLICLEGLISAGKTTAATLIQEYLDGTGQYLPAILYSEPVEDNPYLIDYYANPTKYAFEMNIWLLKERIRQYEEACQGVWNAIPKIQPVIFDRSPFGDMCFARLQYKLGTMSERQYCLYNELTMPMFDKLRKPHIILYLAVSSVLAQQRLQHRGRECESNISIPYLEGLKSEQEKLFFQDESFKNLNVWRIDWKDYDFEKVKGALK